MPALLGLLAALGCERREAPAVAPVTPPAPVPRALCAEPDCLPGFRATTIDDVAITSDDLRGRPALVLFWASWCEPCTAEGPSLQDVHRRRGTELALIGFSRDQVNAQAMRTFRDRHGIRYPVALVDDATFAAFGRPEEVPTFLLYGSDGRLRWKMTGALPAAVLERELDAALR